jgi:hypothetical protein
MIAERRANRKLKETPVVMLPRRRRGYIAARLMPTKITVAGCT